MQNYSSGSAQSQNEQSLFMWEGFDVSYKEVNNYRMVNVTQMAQSFGKRPGDWLKTQQANDLIEAMTVTSIFVTNELKQVKRGGKNQGTWLHEDLALVFAQFLSPTFYLACNTALKKAITVQLKLYETINGVVPYVVDSVAYYHYLTALESMAASTTSGMVCKRKKMYPAHFKTFFRQNFIGSALFKHLVEKRMQEDRDKLLRCNQLNLAV